MKAKRKQHSPAFKAKVALEAVEKLKESRSFSRAGNRGHEFVV
ncbi:hypothetical protein [Spirosoma endbachense]|nr:hypothetical protein [Spirosoma endbachense]